MYENFEKIPLEEQQRLLQVCIAEFSTNGYQQASTNTIVKQAGIPKGTLFYFFGSKKDLYLYVLDYAIRQFARRYTEMAGDMPTDLFERLLHRGRIKFQFAAEEPELFQLFYNAFINTPQEIQEITDFKTNTLGVCKHIFNALDKVKKRFPQSARRRAFRRTDIEVYVDYGKELTLRVGLPSRMRPEVEKVVRPLRDRPVRDVPGLVKRLGRLERMGQSFTVFPDAEEFIQQRLFQDRIQGRVAEIRKDPANHPLRKQLLKTELLPYQLDGIAFAVGAGRAVLADDMGLGKTIQGIGVAELLAREAGISQGAGRLPRLAEVAVAQRDRPVLRPRLPAGAGQRGGAGGAVRQRLRSSRSATTSRCSATSWPSSGSSGT